MTDDTADDTMGDEMGADLVSLAELRFSLERLVDRRSRSTLRLTAEQKSESDRRAHEIQQKITEVERRIYAREWTKQDLAGFKYATMHHVPPDERFRAADHVLGYADSDTLRRFYDDFGEQVRDKPEDWRPVGAGSLHFPMGQSVRNVLRAGGFDWGGERLDYWWFRVFLEAARRHVEEGKPAGEALRLREEQRRRQRCSPWERLLRALGGGR